LDHGRRRVGAYPPKDAAVTENVFLSTLLPYLGSQVPELIALLVAIIVVAVNWSRDRRKAALGVVAFGLALVCTLVWPFVVATSSWLYSQDQVNAGLVLNGGVDFVLNALVGLAWLLIVLALFGRQARES
jgi:multisubunit Na+/H+ antiporter MnhB subunit